jgi:glutamine synthetase
MRSKCRTLPTKIESLADLPEWNYDGSSTYQATTESSEIILKPAFYFADPFRGGDNVMVLCETYSWTDGTFKELTPSNTNFRKYAKEIFDSKPDE